MQKIRNILASLAAAVLLTGLAINFNACSEQSPLAADNALDLSLAKRGNNTGGSDGENQDGNSQGADYPQFASRTFTYNSSQNQYTAGNMQVPGGTSFSVAGGALTPPPDSTFGADITLTMQVEKKKYKGKQVLLFTFGPHGSSFSPRAEVTFDWTDLGFSVADLYYLDDDGNLVLQAADQIDIQNRKMTLYLDHFSRYAIGGE
jgi:hypothetical protein